MTPPRIGGHVKAKAAGIWSKSCLDGIWSFLDDGCQCKMETTPVDDPRARYVNEPGLYKLIARSTMEKAKCFQDWVYEKVLPSIRKTGSYSVQPAASAANQNDGWLDKRLDGKELMKVKNASL